MSSFQMFCIHDNFPSTCRLCNNCKPTQYCRLCRESHANHNEYTCPYKTHAAISSAMRQRACRALGCMTCLPGQTHYCDFCRDNDATHRSLNCPLRSSINNTHIAQPQIAYVTNNRSRVVVINNPPVVIVRNNHSQPIIIAARNNKVNGLYYFG